MSWVSRLCRSCLCMGAQRKLQGHGHQSERRNCDTQPNMRRDTWGATSIHDVVAHIKTIEWRIARRVYTNVSPAITTKFFVVNAWRPTAHTASGPSALKQGAQFAGRTQQDRRAPNGSQVTRRRCVADALQIQSGRGSPTRSPNYHAWCGTRREFSIAQPEVTSTHVEKARYSFTGGADGSVPSGSLVRDAQGNFYGTTSQGGASSVGTVLKLAP